jgi:ADP-L-glycero-D-manno-heptose 6-epimerase
MIIVTGAAGFIGSVMIAHLNARGHQDVVAVDDFGYMNKNSNLQGKKLKHWVHRDDALVWMKHRVDEIEAIFHLGARTDTTEFDQGIFDRLNINYSKAIWAFCSRHDIPLLYASSAATYGDGQLGYCDDHEQIHELKPLNPYGVSKQLVDEWILSQSTSPTNWYGFKFFNVYGPNEYHKGRMASVIFHAFNQIQATGRMKLFRSHRVDVPDGHQSRDFIYVHNVVEVLYWFFIHRPQNGIYNLGTGKARTFLHLVEAVFRAMNIKEDITFIDTPEDIRDTYQYFTEADMTKFKSTGCAVTFTSLENGVMEYVTEYLFDRKQV